MWLNYVCEARFINSWNIQTSRGKGKVLTWENLDGGPENRCACGIT